MAITNAKPRDVIDLPLGPALATGKTATLAKTKELELVRLVVPAGKEVPTHRAPGDTTVQCLEGRIAITAHGQTQELAAGQLLMLTRGELHHVTGIEDASLLLTIHHANELRPQRFDVVHEASEESFPASDSPAWTPVMRP